LSFYVAGGVQKLHVLLVCQKLFFSVGLWGYMGAYKGEELEPFLFFLAFPFLLLFFFFFVSIFFAFFFLQRLYCGKGQTI